MRIRQFILFAAIGCGTLPSLRADEAAAKQKLAALGVRVTGSSLLLTDELKLNQDFAKIALLKRKLTSASKSLQTVEAEDRAVDEQIGGLLQQNVQLNSQLASTNSANTLLYNRLVAAVNANQAQIKLMSDSRERFRKQLDAARQEANTAREGYLQHVIVLRKTADAVAAKYAQLAKNEEAKSALEEWNTATKTKLKLDPSRAMAANLKKLETLEKSVLSEKIPLRREGNSFYASVVIDGKRATEMVVDSGASIISLPHQIALDAGIEVDESDRDITLVIANGDKIKGKLKTIDSVRVGKFTAENVECAILGPEATEAKALLGMSFLGHFKFELNAQASELTLLKIEGEGSTKPKPAAKAKPAKQRPAKSLKGERGA